MVQESLDGRGLTLVLSTVNEFLQYHHKVDQDLYHWELRDDLIIGLLSRLDFFKSDIMTLGRFSG